MIYTEVNILDLGKRTGVLITDYPLLKSEKDELVKGLGSRKIGERVTFIFPKESKEDLQILIRGSDYGFEGRLPLGNYFLDFYKKESFGSLEDKFDDVEEFVKLRKQ